MRLYMCDSCKRILHKGEDHSCVINKIVEEVYAVPQLNVSEEMKRKAQKSKRTHAGNSNENNGNTCPAVQQNDIEESSDMNALLTENNEQISSLTLPRRKRSHSSSSPSECVRGTKNGQSISALSSNIEGGGKKSTAKKCKKCSTMNTASAQDLVGENSSTEMALDSVTLGPVSESAASVAGPSGIQRHSQKTGKEKLFGFDVCGKAFARRNYLEAPDRTYDGDNSFVCSTCGKAFTRPSGLTRHLLTHTGEKSFKCEFCSKGFGRKDSLEAHLRTHTGEKPFACVECRKGFGRKDALESHLRTHTGEKPFVCEECRKGFASKQGLWYHLQTHTGEKP